MSRHTFIGTLTRVKNGRAMRTDSIHGAFSEAPTPGLPFQFISEPLDPAKDARLTQTSLVLEVDATERGFLFRTLNSVYRLSNVVAVEAAS